MKQEDIVVEGCVVEDVVVFVGDFGEIFEQVFLIECDFCWLDDDFEGFVVLFI